MPIGVLDVIISADINIKINIANLCVHFTGNASGGVQRVIFGGINAIMVMASANINELIFAKIPKNNTHWATLYERIRDSTGTLYHAVPTSRRM